MVRRMPWRWVLLVSAERAAWRSFRGCRRSLARSTSVFWLAGVPSCSSTPIASADSSGERAALHAPNQLRTAEYDSSLRATEELVTAEERHIRALAQARMGLPLGNSVGLQVDEGPASPVVDHGDAVSRPELGELLQRDLPCETPDLEVAPVHLEQHARLRAQSTLVVLEVGAVGRPDLA